MTVLAIELRDAKTRDWRWWQLAHHSLTTRQIRLMYGPLVGLGFGLVWQSFGPIVGVPSWSVGLGFGLIGLRFGPTFGRFVGSRAVPAHTDLRIRSRADELRPKLKFGFRSGLLVGLGGALLVALAGVLNGDLILGPVVGLVSAPIFGLVFGLSGMVLGLIRFAASPNIAQRALSPADSQRGDRQLTMLASIMLGLMFGLMFVPGFGLMDGLVVGLVFGLIGGQLMTNTGWPAFILASLWLGASHRLPFRLMEFLNDMYRLGLLRIVGPVYQFRHAALQDHLAPPNESPQSTDPPAPPSSNRARRRK